MTVSNTVSLSMAPIKRMCLFLTLNLLWEITFQFFRRNLFRCFFLLSLNASQINSFFEFNERLEAILTKAYIYRSAAILYDLNVVATVPFCSCILLHTGKLLAGAIKIKKNFLSVFTAFPVLCTTRLMFHAVTQLK